MDQLRSNAETTLISQTTEPAVNADLRVVPRRTLASLLTSALLFAIAFLFLLPYVWMLLSSFKTTADLFRHTYPITWQTFIPPEPTLANYESIFFQWNFGRSMLNSLIASTAQMVGTLITCSLAAFVFARLHFRGRDILFALVIVVALVPLEVNMIPLYVVMRNLHLQSTYGSLFLPWIANPFGIFLLRQAFAEIPRDYDDAARIEGASHLQVFWHVILPNARPALITLALMSFLWSWNAFLWPLIVMQDPTKQVVQVSIATFTLPQAIPAWGEIFAASSVATIPILVLFIVLQRYYIHGAVMSGMKG